MRVRVDQYRILFDILFYRLADVVRPGRAYKSRLLFFNHILDMWQKWGCDIEGETETSVARLGRGT